MFRIILPLIVAAPSYAAPLAYITNQGSNDVSVIDLANNKVVATVPVGKAPAGIAVSSAAGKAFVTNPESKDMSVIDLKTNPVIDSISYHRFARREHCMGARTVAAEGC